MTTKTVQPEKTKTNETEKVPEVIKEKMDLSTIEADADGSITGKNLQEQQTIATLYQQSGFLPDNFNTVAKILTGMHYCHELKIAPLTGMKNMYIINGSPALFGDLPLAIARRSGLLEWIREYYIDKEGNEISAKNKNLSGQIYGAVCVTKRKNDKYEKETSFTIDEASTAALTSKDVWKKYTKTMLKYRARAENIKDQFSDALNGIAIAEYDHNDIPIQNEQPAAITDEIKILDERTKALIRKIKTRYNILKYNEAKKLQLHQKYLETKELEYAEYGALLTLGKFLRSQIENSKETVNADKDKDTKSTKA